jgi:hypothetical protein
VVVSVDYFPRRDIDMTFFFFFFAVITSSDGLSLEFGISRPVVS